MGDKKIKGIPYGVSGYEDIRKKNFYYVDKTAYLPILEDTGQYLFFIRPRRFGKSLLLSMMQKYYDIHHKGRFEELFGGTWIYNHPTNERGQYLVLAFNFSVVSPDPNMVELNFLEYIRGITSEFIRKYRVLLSGNKTVNEYLQSIKKSSSAADVMVKLILLLQSVQQKVYVFIDEYDNFANTILTTIGESAYHNLTHGDGFLRAFFNVLKAGTGDDATPISRLFITGVSPITMDDVTSGFNIGKNVSLNSNLNQMLGFTHRDVEIMMNYYGVADKIRYDSALLMDIMTQWYGNYLFSGSEDVTLFNSDMVLYYIDQCLMEKKMPDDLVDRNVRIDYGKLKHLIVVDRRGDQLPTTNGNFSKLKQIIEEGSTLSKIASGFPLKELLDTDNFKSLLFYFGLLTIKGRERNRYRLQIPNESVRRLYYDYIEKAYQETGVFSLNLSKYADLMDGMAYDGLWQPLFQFVLGQMKVSMRLRDLITGEKSIQAFLNVYLGLSDFYIIHSEKELNKGYADLVLEPFLGKYNDIRYAYLLEIKYVKAGLKADDDLVTLSKAQAEAQLRRYAMDDTFAKSIGKTMLIKLALVFSGHEVVYIDQVRDILI